MAYPSIWVHAPRKRPEDPHRPGNETILFDIDDRHPDRIVKVAEGGEAEVWPHSPKVKEKLATGELKKGRLPRDEDGEVEVELNPESLHSLGLTQPTVAALGRNNVTMVSELLGAWESGDIEEFTGIGDGRMAEIEKALVEHDHIEPPEA